MQYSIRHLGEIIGTTDLGYMRVPGLRTRMGSFHPTPAGEALTRMVATPTPAFRAYIEYRNGNTEATMPGFEETEMFDEATAAMALSASVKLTLHAEDGRLIPTEDIGIRDTEVLLALAREAEKEFEADAEFDADLELEDFSVEYEAPDLESDVETSSPSFELEPWTPDEPDFPRYQVIVFPVVDEEVP